jgi:hypothetical protein
MHKKTICGCHSRRIQKTSAKKIYVTNYWALDSTFKTNQYGLPLYEAIMPNQDEIGIPIFICFVVTLIHIFELLKKIRPSAIVIDKHNTSLNAML